MSVSHSPAQHSPALVGWLANINNTGWKDRIRISLLHPSKTNSWNPKMEVWKMKIPFQRRDFQVPCFLPQMMQANQISPMF